MSPGIMTAIQQQTRNPSKPSAKATRRIPSWNLMLAAILLTFELASS
jgi:hypothetical protein